MKNKLFLQTITLFICLGAALPVFAQIAVIVNPHNPHTSFTRKELAAIYRLKRTTWSDGQKIKLLNLPVSDQTRAKFSRAILKRSPRMIESLYFKIALSSSATVPQVLKSAQEIIDYVSNNPNALAYINVKDIDPARVKVLSVEGTKELE